MQARRLVGAQLRSCQKVKAHTDSNEVDITARERFLRLGNLYADHAAKSALEKHHSADKDVFDEFDCKIEIAKHVFKLGAAIVSNGPS